MNFIGRQDEIKAMDYSLRQKGYQGILVYGRRRIGKTELIKHVISGRPPKTIYFQCTDDSERSNAELLGQAIGETFGLPGLHFTSFAEALDGVFALSEKEETCLVIDEYPYIQKLVPGLDSQLQKIIDQHLQKAQMKFILSGSAVSIMSELLSANNPLYRRFQLSLFLQEQDYFEAAQYYPSFSEEDKVRLYSAFGGVPFYNRQVDEKLTVKENIIRLLSGPFARLEDEVTINLRSELSKIANANNVFSVVAEGYSRFSDILSQSHLTSSSLLSAVMDALCKMDLLRKSNPINDETSKQKTFYALTDNAFSFYYRYLFLHKSARNVMNAEDFYETYIAQDFETKFVPAAFERIARQYLIRKNKAGAIKPPFLAIGSYWYDDPKTKQNGQFDVVGKKEKGYVFYEVKFREKPLADNLIQEEAAQILKTHLPVASLGFFSRSGYALKKSYPYIFYTLEDLYK
jgi:AAA+ ATPase superfamily predicted ATPase